MASSQNIRCQLTEWGLPPLIIGWFKKRGITSLFEWQVECLCKDNVLCGGNLVYSAPTSAGKTLVADFLLLKKVLEYNKKALVIEPFVALTREKADTLKSMLYNTKARVGAFGGSYYTPGGMAAIQVAVCTIEKANNFINKLINENKLSDLGIIVVDEIHYIGDDRRGYQLELLLTKVLYYNIQQDKSKRIQIVGLSATIPNLKTIANWLQGSLYVTSYRPIPLVEKIKISECIYEASSYLENPSCKPLETILPTKLAIEKDFDDLCYICINSIVDGHSTLVFCESKRECELMAANLSQQIRISGNRLDSENFDHVDISKRLRGNLSSVKICAVIDKLKKCPAGPDKELIKSLNMGVAFHHAGLTSEEREIIEDGFKSGAIKTLMATSTLSSGVNLPARKVIIRSPTMIYSGNGTFQKIMLNPTSYKQMIGRAGRKGIDTCGESILICNPENQDIAIQLIKASLGNITSALANRMIAIDGNEPSGLKKAVLEVIANNTAKSKSSLDQYLKSTFWLSSISREEELTFQCAVSDTIRYLVDKKFMEELKPGEYRATRLGKAVLSSGLHPDESLELLQDLLEARKGFCLLNDLHIIYQVTPNEIARAIELKDWHNFSRVWNELDEVCRNVGERIGIDEFIIVRRCQGSHILLSDSKERIYRRFWVALAINDLIHEISLPKICSKYRLTKATVQQAQRAVAQFAGVMSIFCNELGYDNIAALVTPLETRINFSCQRDLLDLIRLNITRPIARSLFNAGYRNVIAVAKADKLDIEFILRQIKPFKKDVSFTGDTDYAPSMWIPELARSMTTLDYASHVVETAISFVEIEYDIDLNRQASTRVENKNTEAKVLDDDIVQAPASKRGRIDDANDSADDTLRNEPAICVSKIEDMVKPNRDVPNFVREYVGKEEREVDKFLNRWLKHSTISLNFKLTQQANESIGAKVRRKIRQRRRKSRDGQKDSKSDDEYEQSQGTDSQDGLSLRLEIDSRRYAVTRLYASFDDELIVYIVNTREALAQIRDKLQEILLQQNDDASCEPIKLYTQDIVLTYKVLYAGFNLSQKILNKNFVWHSFDVAWWMVNNCPNRGINNCHSSLSLVAKTKWACNYRHFLYPSNRQGNRSSEPRRTVEEFLKLKDIVKAGKTAILQPLINEILTELRQRDQLKAYYDAEIPSRLTMAQMMVHGMGLDMKGMKNELALYQDLTQQLTDIAQKYFAKSTVSLTNIKHVARVLYEDLDLKKYLLDHATNSDISKDPTNGEILNILAHYHPFPKLVQDFRKIRKAMEALQSASTHARFNSELTMMRVFGNCDFWQLTGRVAMSDPDLFLINRNFSIVIPAHGNRLEETIECTPRKCFVPIPGWCLLAADYSQLELRLLANFSNDDNLLEILNRTLDSDQTFDVFKTVASKICQKSIDKITSEDRQHTKQICYGIIYGMGDRTLSNQLGVTIEKASEFRKEFFNAFPRILTYTDELIDECEQLGYVESILGRRRTLEGIKAENSSVKSRAKRVAINTRIQSSASDIIKLAMKALEQKIIANYHNNVRLVLEMHDELIYEVNPDFVDEFSSTLRDTMENLPQLEDLKVKLLVNLKKGTDWSNIRNFINYAQNQNDCT